MQNPIEKQSMSILIVDDDADAHMVLSDLSIEHGYDVATAADGVEALKAAAKEKPDLALVDTRLPKCHCLSIQQGTGIALHGNLHSWHTF